MSDKGKQPTLYEILGVSPTATLREIKDAYREKTHQYHPDVNPNINTVECHQMMCMINDAYAILRDIESRMKYDQTLRESRQYPSESHLSIEGETTSRTDSQNYNQNARTRSSSFYYEIYEYYNRQDYDYYQQQQFVEYVKGLYDYYFNCINTDDFKTARKEMTLLEKLKEFFEYIIDIEKIKSKKRLKSNSL